MADAPGQTWQSSKPQTPAAVSDSDPGSSTQALPMAGGSDRSQSGSGPAASASGSGAGDARGKSTSLETMLGRVFIDRGYITADELDACRSMQAQAHQAGDPRALPDILVDNEYVTRKQLDRVRTELEAEKSTQQIPGYKILRRLGSGAMATVFLAKQLSLDRFVAIKVLPSKFSSNQKFIERFYKEGRAAAQLNHRNIVGAFDVGQAGEHHYFVMEFVDGDTVYDRILSKKRLAEKDALTIVRQTAEALLHAHGKGFIHRDIKPKNIMLSKDGTVKLADLGLARAVSDKEAAEAEAGRAYGTPYYISPEQIRGSVEIGPPADIYGLGATFYHMVTGKVPFEGRNPSSVMHKHLKAPLIPPDHVNPKVNAYTAQVIEMMMAKSRKDRYQNVQDLITDLDHLAKGEPPHFAKAQSDINSIATGIDENAATETVIQNVTRQGGRGLPLENPFVVGLLALLGVSILVNMIMISVLMRRPSGAGSGVPAGTNAASPHTPVSATILGSWESSELRGEPFANSAQVVYVFGRDGRGHYVHVDRQGDARPVPIRYRVMGQTVEIRVVGGGSATYDYEIRGDTLILQRGNGAVHLTFIRVN